MVKIKHYILRAILLVVIGGFFVNAQPTQASIFSDASKATISLTATVYNETASVGTAVYNFFAGLFNKKPAETPSVPNVPVAQAETTPTIPEPSQAVVETPALHVDSTPRVIKQVTYVQNPGITNAQLEARLSLLEQSLIDYVDAQPHVGRTVPPNFFTNPYPTTGGSGSNTGTGDFTSVSIGDLSVSNNFSVTGTATSTFTNGLNITSGCFAINGTCITGTGGSTTWGSITGTLSNQTDLQNALNAKLSITAFDANFAATLSGTTSDAVREGSTNLYFSNTRVNNFLAASTTIAKTFASNIFTASNTFSSGLVANGGFTIGTINGPLQANNGVVTATTSVGVLYGGTGLTTAPTNGQILLGNSSGGFSLVATSSLGISGGGSSQWMTSGSDIYYTTGSVGVGTSSPVSTFAVNGTTTITKDISLSASSQIIWPGTFPGNKIYSSAANQIDILGAGNGIHINRAGIGDILFDSQITANSGASFSGLVNMNGGGAVPDAAYLNIGQGYLAQNGNLGGFVINSGTTYSRISFQHAGVEKMILNNGNLGIGTSSPYAKLSVAGNGVFDGNITATNITATGTLNVAGSISGGKITASAVSSALAFEALTGPYSFAGILIGGNSRPGKSATLDLGDYLGWSLAASGKITVNDNISLNSDGTASFNTNLTGTTQPAVDIQGSFIRIGDGLSNASFSGGLGIKFVDSGASNGSMIYNPSNSTFTFCDSNNSQNDLSCNNGGYITTNTSGAALSIGGFSSPTAGNLMFGDGTGWKMNIGRRSDNAIFTTFTDTGNIGIGTSSPYAKLSVAGDIVATNITATGTLNVAGTSVFSSNATFNGNATVPDASYLIIGNGYITQNGALGGFAINSGSVSSRISFQHNAVEKMVLNNGNLGIGTSSPYAKLSVVGEAVASNFTATSSTASSTFAGGIKVGSSANAQINPQGQVFTTGLYISNTYDQVPAGGIFFKNASGGYNSPIYYDHNSGQLVLGNGSGIAINTTSASWNTTNGDGWNFSVESGLILEMHSINGSIQAATFHPQSSAQNVLAVKGKSGQTGDLQQWLDSNGNVLDTVTASGSVGIGTTSPYAKLAVVGQTVADYFTAVSSTVSSFNGGVTIPNATNYTVGGSTITENGFGGIGFGFNAASPYNITFQTNNTPRLSILQANGNVGIGTTSPYEKLSVAGTIVGANFVGTTTATSTFGGGINISSGCFAINGTCLSTGGSGSGTVNSGTLGQLAFYGSTGTAISGTSSVSISTDGTLNVGAGTEGDSLFQYGVDANGWLTGYNTADKSFRIASSSTDLSTNVAFTIAKGGNVGLGTTSPYAKLSVSGTVVADAFIATSTTASSTIASNLSIGNNASVTASGKIGSLVVGSVVNSGIIRSTSNSATALGYSSTSGVGTSIVSAQALGSFVSGYSTAGSANASVTASGIGSAAFGVASGGGSVAAITSSGNASFAIGYANLRSITASGQGSFAGGNASNGNITATTNGAFAFGDNINSTASLATSFGSGFTNSTANSFMVGYSATPTLFVNSTSIGLSSTTPWAALSVHASGGGSGALFAVASSTNGAGTTTAFVIDKNGNVGIGTSSPASTLTVTGSACISKGAGATAACSTTAGTITANVFNTAAADLAERYKVQDTTIDVGDVVMLDDANALTVKKAVKGSGKIFGIVSTEPGFLLGSTNLDDSVTRPIALAGRVPVKFSVENGPIKIGDALTLSSTMPGYAAKASSTSAIIGTALENMNSNGKVTVFVRSSLTSDFELTTPDQELVIDNSSLTNDFTALLGGTGSWMHGRLSAVNGFFKNIFADVITARKVKVKDGIEMVDKITGSTYCVSMANGELQKTPGTCDSVANIPQTGIVSDPTPQPPAVTPTTSTSTDSSLTSTNATSTQPVANPILDTTQTPPHEDTPVTNPEVKNEVPTETSMVETTAETPTP